MSDAQEPRADVNANESRQDLWAIAELAQSLSVHLRESWPVRGQGQPVAGPPGNATHSDLYRHLLNLKTFLFRFRPPDIRERSAWLQARARVLQAPDVAAALAQIDRVTDHLADQFNASAALKTVDGHRKVVLTPTLHAERLWQPPGGRPTPEIDPQDIRSLGWSAAKLFQALGEEAPVPQVGEWAPGTGAAEGQGAESQEDWRPASKAVADANDRGYPIRLDWISKRKDRIRTRPRHLPGKHQLEVEMGSLARVLFAEARPKGGETDTDEPDGAARDKIEARKRFEQERKSRAFD